MRSGDDTFRGGKGKDSKGTTHKGKSKESNGGKVAKTTSEVAARVAARAPPKVRVDPKQRLVSPNVGCAVKKGHWEGRLSSS